MNRYFKHFMIPFIIFAVGIVACVILHVAQVSEAASTEEIVLEDRQNTTWTDSQRVFDYADKLTDEDEAALTETIYYYEQLAHIDMAVLVLDENLTSYVDERRDKLDYEVDTAHQVMVYGDDWSYEHGLGWNGFNGDAIVIVDNWSREADGKVHSWASTSGRCINAISSSRCSTILSNDITAPDDADSATIRDCYAAAVADFANAVAPGGSSSSSLSSDPPFEWYVPIIMGIIAAAIYIGINIRSKVGDVTVNKGTYIVGNRANFTVNRDTFNHKTVTKTARPKDTGSSGGSHSSSGGGSFGGGGSSR